MIISLGIPVTAKGATRKRVNDRNAGLIRFGFVQAGGLPHWSGQHFQHAVVVVGIEAQTVYLMDPALGSGPTVVDEAAFMYSSYRTFKVNVLDNLEAMKRPVTLTGFLL